MEYFVPPRWSTVVCGVLLRVEKEHLRAALPLLVRSGSDAASAATAA
jgi:hypothetical protein